MWGLPAALLLATGAGAKPVPVPKSFDCGVRRLAYTYGKQLLPAQDRFESLFYALGLDQECSGELSGPAQAAASPERRAPSAGAVFVDPVHGDDGQEGSELRPKASVHAAVAAAAATEAKEVVLRGGSHFLEKTLLLGSEHSGLTIRSYPGEHPVVSGGVPLKKAEWKPHNVSGGANIYVADVKGEVKSVPGLHVAGARATRARYPNLQWGIEASPGYGGLIGGNRAKWTPPQFSKFGEPVYFVDQTPAHLRDNSADHWFQKYAIGTNGLCSVYDPPVSYWCSNMTAGGGAFPFRTPSGISPSRGSLPNAPYKDPSQALFNVWRPARWENWMFKVARHEVTDDAPLGNFTFGHGGFQGARGENVGGDWFVEDVFEELDSPGEFFFNESTGQLFLWYNGTGAPPRDLSVVVPQLDVLVNVSGSQWSPVRGMKMEGIRFSASRHTYLHPHGVPSGGDWALERIGAVFLEGTEGVTMTNCSFERLDGHGLFISGYNRNATVQDSVFEFIGGSAIASWGYTNETANSGFPYYRPNSNYPQAGVDGTDGNHPRGNKVLRNLIREVGLYEKQNSFYVQAKTAESRIVGNVAFNGPRAGMNANDGFGGGDDISYNLVFSSCRESGDHGPFNSWDRQPYLTTVRTGDPSMIMQWREIHHNFFVDNYSPQEGVDNDDGSAYYHTHDNFLVYGTQGMKSDFGGHDNWHMRNIYAYVGQAAGLDRTTKGGEDRFFGNRVVMYDSHVGTVMCQEPRTQLSNNSYFTPDGLLRECGKSLADVQAMGMDQGSTVEELPSDDAILGWAKELLGIRERELVQLQI